jgi:DNA invertase Pin-like site-specific DNA recombinase
LYREFLKGLKVCIYLRKSRTDLEEEAKAALRGEKYDTLQRHRSELLRFAKDNELIIVDIFEEVESGSTIANRDEIQNVLANVEKNKYDAVLCIAYDRLTRGDKEDQGKIENTLKKRDTLILTPSKIYDLNSEEGETSADIDSFISRMEYRRIKRRLEDGKHRSATLGMNVSNKVPFGFTKDAETKKLIPYEPEAQYVRMIYSLCIEGYGTAIIASKLYNMGVHTRKGNVFTKKTVADIIKNVKYKGDQFYGRTKNKAKTKNYTYTENAHTSIVSPEDWRLANNMMKQRNAPVPRTKELKNPFASILKCSFCNKTMKAVHNRGTIRLICDTHGCSCRSVLLDIIEAKVIEAIQDILSNIEVEPMVEENNILEQLMKQKDNLEKNIDDLIEQRKSLHEFLEKRIYTPEVFLERQEVINMEIDALREKQVLLNEDIENELNKHNNAKNLKPLILNCMDIYFKSNPTQKNKLLRSFISKINYTRHKTDNLIKDIVLEVFLK